MKALVVVAVLGACGAKHTGPPPKTVFEKVLVGPPLVPHTLAMNDETACAIAGDLRVECWGSGVVIAAIGGGDGDVVPLPRAIATLADAEELAMGANHLCIERNGGEVVCFGGDDPKSATRRAIEGIPPARRVAVGGTRACATGVDGTVWCWGWSGATSAPRRVAGIDDARDVAVGDKRACAQRATGAATCWALDDATAQLADLPGDRDVRQIVVDAADHVCVVGAAVVRCADEDLIDLHAIAAALARARGKACALAGDGGVTCQPAAGAVLEVVPAIHDAIELAMGGAVACARRADRSVACWGARDRSGLLGEGIPTFAPATDVALPPVATIAASGDAVCAALVDGGARCWGDGKSTPTEVFDRAVRFVAASPLDGATCGIAIDGNAQCASEGRDPEWIRTPERLAAFAAARHTACAIDTKGHVQCWEPGDTKADPVALSERAVRLAVGDDASCALLASGRVQCWGTKPDVDGLVDVRDLAMGGKQLCVLRRNHPPRCVGEPLPIANPEDLADADAFAISALLACKLDGTGDVWCVEGYGDTMHPIAIRGAKVVQVVAGSQFGCVRRADRTVACFGAWDAGQLGDGRAFVAIEPQPVAGLH